MPADRTDGAVTGLRIRPEKRGIRAALYDLEADVMEVVWGKRWDAFTVADVHRQLARDREIAYTTVMTTVRRLADKGLLACERQGRRYLYRPRMDRRTFLRETTRTVLEHLADGGPDAAVALLVERVSRADAAELDRLEALIEARKRELAE